MWVVSDASLYAAFKEKWYWNQICVLLWLAGKLS